MMGVIKKILILTRYMAELKFNLQKQYSLITGASGLLGEQHAIALLEINSNIILTDINYKKLI